MKHNILILVYMMGCFFAEAQVNLTLTGRQPYPVLANNYIDDVDIITARVQNLNRERSYDLKAYVKITGPKGIFISSGNPTCDFVLERSQVLLFGSQNYEDLCIDLNSISINSVLNNSSLSQQEKNLFTLSRVLPEGNYSYCLTLKDANTNADVTTSCIDININHPDRPSLIRPMDQEMINGVQTILNVSWSHIVNDSRLRENLSYNVKIISLGNNYDKSQTSQNPATQLMDDPSVIPFIEERDIPYANKNLAINIQDYPFENGHTYAVRVTAQHNGYQYSAESSQSDVHVFTFINQITLKSTAPLTVKSVFPLNGEYVPFASFAGICKFEPYKDYNELSYVSTLKDVLSYSPKIIKVYDRKTNPIKWANGPKVFLEQQLRIENFDQENYYSSHQVSFAPFDDLPTFERGKLYHWNSTGDFSKTNEGSESFYMDVNFAVGMPPMRLAEPISASTLPAGNVNLKATHNKIPTSPMPPFKVMQWNQNNQINYDLLTVNEEAVIQVSRKKDFSHITQATTMKVETTDIKYLNTSTRMYDKDRFIAEVYKDVEFAPSLKDTGWYFWRVGWLKDPSNGYIEPLGVQTEKMYSITIDSFRIRKSDQKTDEGDEICINECERSPIVNQTILTSTEDIDTIMVGFFKMKVDKLTKNGDLFSGSGRIHFPFLRNINLKVTFDRIKINTDRVVFNGTVRGKQGGNELESLASLLHKQDIELPFGIDTTINGYKLTLAHTEFVFSPTRADATVSLSTQPLFQWFEVTSVTPPILSTTICVTPTGFEKDFILHLGNDVVIQPSESGYGLELNGGPSISDTSRMTYFKFSCGKFHSFQVAGTVLLSTSTFSRDSGNNNDDKPQAGQARGEFKFKYFRDQKDWMISGRMEHFQVNEAPGWGFHVDTFYLDISDNINPPNFTGPEGYKEDYFNDHSKSNTWKGLYIPKIQVKSPDKFIRAEGRTDFGTSSMIMGDGIYYLRHRKFNAVTMEGGGNLGRMKASVDTIDVILSNIDFKFSIMGKIQIPFVEENKPFSYKGQYDNSNDWGLTLQAPKGSCIVPIWNSYLQIYENSYFFLGKHKDSSRFMIKTTLNGFLTVDSDIIAKAEKRGLKDLKFTKLEFENLGYESGKGFLGGASFSKASPQKKLNGFPAQLDSIAFADHNGNPGIYFKPRLTIAGDSDGFSVAVGFGFYGTFDNKEPLDIFNGYYTKLDVINIDVKVKRCSFEGILRFIDTETESGLEGEVNAMFPANIAGKFRAKFGNITIDKNAAFNTPNNYNYWYVDGLIAWGGNGIPVFSGVNLYGVGGGMWYNMEPDGKKIVPTSLLTESTSEQAAKNSTIQYAPKQGGGYGLKLQGLFGDPKGGDTYNMALAVEATFPTSGGPIVILQGDVFIMSEKEDINDQGTVEKTKKSLWGTAVITYDGQKNFIDGNIDVFAAIQVDDKKVLHGIGPPTDRVVGAKFYAETNGGKWFLYVGEPDNRAGVKITSPVDVEVSAYFMMGEGIPGVVPEPHPEFMAMLNSGSSHMTSNNPHTNQQALNTSNGIAFGALLNYKQVFEPTPFYLDLQLIMGFDVLFSKSSTEIICAETNRPRGKNGFYATGQVFAGLKGDFGINIDLWFISCRKSIFSGSAALYMKVGLPNPSWFYGKGTLRYDIAGLVRGSHSFEMEMGTKCTPIGGNPFGGDVITDIYPDSAATDVSVFAFPKVSYAFPIEQPFDLIDDATNKPRSFRLMIENYSLDNGAIVREVKHVDDNFVSIFALNGYFAASTRYKFTIKVKGQEYINNSWKDVIINGKLWSESKTTTFKTGIKPDSLDDKQLAISYPLKGQRFFLKDETEGKMGFIRLTSNDKALLKVYKTNTIKNKPPDYKYTIEFVPADSKSESIVEDVVITHDPTVLKFSIANLALKTRYTAIIKRQILTPVPTALYTSYAQPTAYKIKTQNNLGEIQSDYEVLVNGAKQFKLTQKHKENEEDKIIYKFVFRTSKFATFKEKFASFTKKETVFRSSKIHDIHHKYEGKEEGFDEYEINGFKVHFGMDDFQDPSKLVEAGVDLKNNVMGVQMSFNSNFKFVGDDNLLLSSKKYDWPLQREFSIWNSTVWNNATLQQSYIRSITALLKSKNSEIKNFDFSISPKGLYEISTPFVKPFKSPISTQQIISTGATTMVSSTNIKMNITGRYGSEGILLNYYNRTQLYHYFMFYENNKISPYGNILKKFNKPLYDASLIHINSPSTVVDIFNLPRCQPAKFGIIYRIPTIKGSKVTFATVINYETPGPCPSIY